MGKPSVSKAKKLFKAFNGRSPEFLDTVHIKDYKTLVYIGPCLEIAYLADDGNSYRHVFRRSSRPQLAVSADGKQLFLLKGRYKFTGRGITDT